MAARFRTYGTHTGDGNLQRELHVGLQKCSKDFARAYDCIGRVKSSDDRCTHGVLADLREVHSHELNRE